MNINAFSPVKIFVKYYYRCSIKRIGSNTLIVDVYHLLYSFTEENEIHENYFHTDMY